MLNYDRVLNFINNAELGHRQDMGKALRALALAGFAAFNVGWTIPEDIRPNTEITHVLKSYDSSAYVSVAILKPGTYTCGPIIFTQLYRLIIGEGVTILFKAGQSDTATLFDIQRSDFTLENYGTINGNRADQGSATNQRLVHSFGYDRVRVVGGERSGLVTGALGKLVWLRDGDGLLIANLRGSSCTDNGFFIEAATASIADCFIDDCDVDRSGQSGTADDTGCIKIQVTATGLTATNCAVRTSKAKASATMNNVAIECKGFDADSFIGGGIFGCETDGPGAGIGQSLARAKDARIIGKRAYNAVTGFELANYTDCWIVGGVADCNSIASSVAIQCVSNANNSAGGGVIGTTAKNFTSKGYLFSGDATYTVSDLKVSDIRAVSASNGALGIHGQYAPGLSIEGDDLRLTGTGVYPVTIENTCTRFRYRGKSIYNGGANEHIRVYNSDYIDMIPGSLEHASGTLATAVLLTNTNKGRCVGGIYKGTITLANKLTADGSGKTVSNMTVGGWGGDGGGLQATEANSGSVGNGNKVIGPTPGFTPYGATDAEFLEFKASYANCLWKGARLAGDPNGVPVDGAKGSTILDETNAKIYVCTTAPQTWTAQA